jgi:hypothetical protein
LEAPGARLSPAATPRSKPPIAAARQRTGRRFGSCSPTRS